MVFSRLKFLPLLPEGSTYTGIDKGNELIKEAREIFEKLNYTAEFIVGDIDDIVIDRKYDIAMSHAFLLHMTDVNNELKKMIDSAIDDGKVICFEPHWISNMSNIYLDGQEHSKVVKLGVLQDLFEKDSNRTGKDGNIGMKLPKLRIKQIYFYILDVISYVS